MTGKKIISVSRNMAATFGIPWLTDKSVAENEFVTERYMPISYNTSIVEAELVGAISPTIWKQVVHRKLVRQLRTATIGGYDSLCQFLDDYGIKGRCIPYRHIAEQYEVLEALYYNRDLNYDRGDYESYDLLNAEIELAKLLPEIQKSIQIMNLNNLMREVQPA